MSEFGKGFIYNLVLFAMHYERARHHMKTWQEMRKENPDLFSDEDAIGLWFNGAGDHFFEFNVPPKWRDHDIGKKARKLQETALDYRMRHKVTKEEFDAFFTDLKYLTRLIDMDLCSVSKKADYE